jgi:DNA-binding NarL/FixJ family response regulator
MRHPSRDLTGFAPVLEATRRTDPTPVTVRARAGPLLIRTLVAEDHALVRAGLAALLDAEDDLQVVAVAGDGEAALRQIELARPQVAVVSVAMPRMTGIEVARKCRDRGFTTAVVVLSVTGGAGFVGAAIEAGVSGCVAKAGDPRELVDAVRAAAAGRPHFGASVARDAVGGHGGGEPRAALTPRERDVLRLIARGLSSKEIADDLGLRTRTVEAYRVVVMDKVGVRHIAGLTKYALRHHLTTLDDD